MLGDGNDQVSASKTNSRLDTDKVVDVRGRQNGTRCLARVRTFNAMLCTLQLTSEPRAERARPSEEETPEPLEEPLGSW
jgi:hypothetical protein